MAQFGQVLVNGFVIGSVYALVAVGFSLVYGVMRLINFAQGGIFTLGAFGTLVLVKHFHLPLIAAILGVAGLGALLGVLIERGAYRPVREAPPLVTLITSLGLLAVIENTLAAIFGSDPIILPETVTKCIVLVGPYGIRITTNQLLGVIASIILLLVLDLSIRRTAIGREMRARADDHLLAATCGINPGRVLSFAFAASGFLGTLGGAIVALDLGCDPYMGTVVGLKAFAACVIGSVRSLRGAVAGGFIVGLLENVVAGYISTTFKTAIVLALLAFMLLFRPNGLLVPVVERKV